MTIVVGDETVELAAGQHGFGPRDIPHRFTVGPDGARMLWVLTPGGFENLIEAASVPAETPTSRRQTSCHPRTSPRSSGATATRCSPIEPRRHRGGLSPPTLSGNRSICSPLESNA